MANPLARVVMNNISQKSGMVNSKPSGVKSTNVSNLGKRETQLLSSLLNKKGVVNSTSSSIDRDSYGRSSGASRPSGSMVTLDSLASKKKGNTESKVVSTKSDYQSSSSNVEVKKSYNTGSGNAKLNSLNALGSVTIGKSNVSTGKKASKETSKHMMQKIDLEGLLSGGNKSSKKETKTSYSYKQQNQQGNRTSLDAFANKAKKVSNASKREESSSETTNKYVRSNVMSNLEAYIPKVTLDSIGKKGSLF